MMPRCGRKWGMRTQSLELRPGINYPWFKLMHVHLSPYVYCASIIHPWLEYQEVLTFTLMGIANMSKHVFALTSASCIEHRCWLVMGISAWRALSVFLIDYWLNWVLCSCSVSVAPVGCCCVCLLIARASRGGKGANFYTWVTQLWRNSWHITSVSIHVPDC